MACFIVPPYVLKAPAIHGEPELRAAALETLELSGQLARQRMLVAEHPAMVAAHSCTRRGLQRGSYRLQHPAE